MIVKVSIVTMETKSVGDNLQCLQQERKGKIQKEIHGKIRMYATFNEDQVYIKCARIVTGVNNKIFQEHVSFYITFFQHLTE